MARHLFLALSLAGALCTPVSAGSLRVDPVEVVINDDRKTASITIANDGASPTTLRISPMAWSQGNGEDAYEATEALIASPPIVTVPAGATQIVRVGFRNPAARTTGSYRVIVEETPREDVAGVQVVLKLNLPLFSRIEPAPPPVLQWSARRAAGDQWIVEAKNPTDGFVRLAPGDLEAGSGLAFVETLKLGVVLPRSHRRWVLNAAPPISNSQRWREITREEMNSERSALAQKTR